MPWWSPWGSPVARARAAPHAATAARVRAPWAARGREGKGGFRWLTNQQMRSQVGFWEVYPIIYMGLTILLVVQDFATIHSRSSRTPWHHGVGSRVPGTEMEPLSQIFWRFLIDFGPGGPLKMGILGILCATKMVTKNSFDDPVWGSHNNLCYSPGAGWDYQTACCSRSFDHRSGSRAGSRQRWDSSSARCRRLPGLGPWFLVGHTLIFGDWASCVCLCLLQTNNGDSNRCWD